MTPNFGPLLGGARSMFTDDALILSAVALFISVWTEHRTLQLHSHPLTGFFLNNQLLYFTGVILYIFFLVTNNYPH